MFGLLEPAGKKMNRIRSALAVQALVLSVLMVWRSTMLAEEEEEEEVGDYGSAFETPRTPVKGVTKDQAAYLKGVDIAILRYGRIAKSSINRFRWMTGGSVVSAAAVPVVLSAGAPSWVAAVLGGTAASFQGIQQLLGDQRRGIAAHEIAVELSRARRLLSLALPRASLPAKRLEVFVEFVDKVEAIRSSGWSTIVEIDKGYAHTNETGSAATPS